MTARSGEPTLTQRINSSVQLPMRESEFVEMMEAHGAKVKIWGTASSPLLLRDYDMSDVSHSMNIYFGWNDSDCRSERYHALVDQSGNVVYVESAFGYPSPLECPQGASSDLTV